jgi:hypothetical protein
VDVSVLRQAPLFTKFSLIVSLAPLVAGIVYAIRPNERRLALMRPLSLAGIFAAVSSLLLGMANALEAIAKKGNDGKPSANGNARPDARSRCEHASLELESGHPNGPCGAVTGHRRARKVTDCGSVEKAAKVMRLAPPATPGILLVGGRCCNLLRTISYN